MRHRIAVIPGDGIGKEVLPEGIRVLDAAGRRFGFDFEWTHFDWSCETYAKTGRMMPEDGVARARNRLRGVKDRLRAGTISNDVARAKVQAWRAHADFANAEHLQRAMLAGVALEVRKRPRRKRKK